MSNQNKQITLDAAKAAVEKWLKQYADGKPFSAVTGLDTESEDYKHHWELVGQVCKAEFPVLHTAVFGPHKGVVDLIFRDREQPESFKLYFYNPDSSAGGLIEECPFTKKDAYCMIGNKDFMDILADRPHNLSDVNSEHFFNKIFELIDLKNDGYYLGSDINAVCRKIVEKEEHKHFGNEQSRLAAAVGHYSMLRHEQDGMAGYDWPAETVRRVESALDAAEREILDTLYQEYNTVVIPCKIGDILYRKDGIWECIGFDCTTGNVWRVKLRRDITGTAPASAGDYLYTKVSFDAFGKTIFFTKEEYDKAFPPKPEDPRFSQATQKLRKGRKAHQQWLMKK